MIALIESSQNSSLSAIMSHLSMQHRKKCLVYKQIYTRIFFDSLCLQNFPTFYVRFKQILQNLLKSSAILVEVIGLEPTTPCLRSMCSPN